MLSGERADWLSAAAKSRLRHRLRATDAAQLAWMVRRRAVVHRMHGWADDTGLLSTGAVRYVTRRCRSCSDLTAVGCGTDGYVRARDFSSVASALGLIRSLSGDVRVRVVADDAG